MMSKQICAYCGQMTWHNMTTAKYSANNGPWRCTLCGYPITSNSAKRELLERFMRKRANRL